MSVLDDLLKKHRKAIIDREAKTFRELVDAYEQVRLELRRQILILKKKIEDATATGEEISPSWFLRERRLAQLIDQVKTQIDRFGQIATAVTSREQEAAVQLAVQQTHQTLVLIAGPNSPASTQLGALLPPRVVENAVGMMGNGSPILEYYAKNLAPKVVEMIRSQVIEAAASGTDFRTIANRLESTGQITRTRALMVARTEVGRVRRETTRQQFIDNPDITGWEWVASKSPRTCPVCLALDGRIFKLDDVFPQHINCRCTLIPIIDGIDNPPRTLGSDWFDEQDDAVKEQIIGKDALAEYKNGVITLKDFVGWRNSKEFGRSVYTKKLSDILMNKR